MKWNVEPNVKEKCLKAFIDLAILWRLGNKPMSGYALKNLLVKELGFPVSVGRVYKKLDSMQINGLIKCVRKKPGRAYILTERGRKIAKNNPDTIEETQFFLKKLLCSQNCGLLDE